MARFESLLTAQVALVLAGCSGEPSQEAWCDGELPDGYEIQEGYVFVELGAECPAVEDLTSSLSGFGCPGPTFQGEVCAFVEKREDQQGTVYGGLADDDTGAPYGSYSLGSGDACIYSGVFEPDTSGAVCGRPLLSHGEPVVAPTVPRTDWKAPLAPDVTDLSATERQRVGAYWLAAAQLEHASVASFARFTLDLIRFGAPPALLAGAQRAGLDEVEHAQKCFALASAYLGRPLGPAPLELGDAAALSESTEAFAEAVLREGCVGETLAVLDAAARLAGTRDPAVRSVLGALIEEEGRHATLAWKTLRWLLDGDQDGRLRAHLAALLPTLMPDPTPAAGEGHAGHGMLSASQRQAVLRDGFERVVLPAWAELIGC